MTITNDKAKEIREDFPIFSTQMYGKPLVYLDNAATTQKPNLVINTVNEFYAEQNANVHRGVYYLSQEATEMYEKAHKTVAQFIGAQEQEIIFTRGTTESINLLSYTLHELIGKRKEILISEMEHHSNMVPWQQFAKRNNLTLKYISMKDNFTLDYDDAKEKITEDTAIVSVGHISNAMGTVNNIKKICTLAKDQGSLSIIDGAQGAAHTQVDVNDIGCDFYAFSGHKMLGPTGIGALYAKKDLLEKMPPFNYGGDMIRKVTYQESTWNDLPMKFEAGTPNIAGGIGFAAAVDYLQKIGMDNIQNWEKELLKYTLEKLKDMEDLEIYNPGQQNSAGILSFNLKQVHAHDVASILDIQGVCIRGGHHCAMPLMDKLNLTGTSRASFYIYNTYEDIDTLIKGLKEADATFRGEYLDAGRLS